MLGSGRAWVGKRAHKSGYGWRCEKTWIGSVSSKTPTRTKHQMSKSICGLLCSINNDKPDLENHWKLIIIYMIYKPQICAFHLSCQLSNGAAQRWPFAACCHGPHELARSWTYVVLDHPGIIPTKGHLVRGKNSNPGCWPLIQDFSPVISGKCHFLKWPDLLPQKCWCRHFFTVILHWNINGSKMAEIVWTTFFPTCTSWNFLSALSDLTNQHACTHLDLSPPPWMSFFTNNSVKLHWLTIEGR